MEYKFKAKVWIFAGPTPWHFITLPKKTAVEIKAFHGSAAKNFGTIGVLAKIEKTRWKTSVFSDTKSQSYVLPLKAEIRKKEKITVGKMVLVQLSVI